MPNCICAATRPRPRGGAFGWLVVLAAVMVAVIGAVPSQAQATEPVLDTAYDTRLNNIITMQMSTSSSDYLALEDLAANQGETGQQVLRELGRARVKTRQMPGLGYAFYQNFGFGGESWTLNWLIGTWHGARWISLKTDKMPAMGEQTQVKTRWSGLRPGDPICGGFPNATEPLVVWTGGGPGGNYLCKKGQEDGYLAGTTFTKEFNRAFASANGTGMATPEGCPYQAEPWGDYIESACAAKFLTEDAIWDYMTVSNTKPWTSGLPWSKVSETYHWQEDWTQPTDSWVLNTTRTLLQSGRYDVLRAWLNHQFDPANYPMPVPDAATRGICENNLERDECLQAKVGDPVNTATGALVEQQTDLSLPGLGVPFAMTRTYNSNGSMLGSTLEDPLGPMWRHAYQTSVEENSDGDVIVTATDGQEVTFVKDGTDFITPAGVRTTLTLDSGVYHLTKSDGSETRYDETTGQVTAMVDRFGNGLDFAYSSGRLSTVTDEAGRVVEFTYDDVPAGGQTQPRLVAVELPDSRMVEYEYADTEVAPLVKVIDVLEGETDFTYEDDEVIDGLLLTSMEDANDTTVVTNTYDDQRRVISQVDAMAGGTTYGWGADGSVLITWPDASTETHLYSGNVLMSQTDGEENTTTYGYDDKLRRTSIEDARGVVTEIEFDSAGNEIENAIPSMGITEERAYDADNNLTSVTDGRGETVTYTWVDGLLVEVESPDGGTVTYTHTADGQVETITDARGKTTTMDYDSAGNIVSSLSPGGAESEFGYDASGRMTSATDPNGGVTEYAYDAADRLVSLTDPRDNETTFTYDATGHLLTTTDADEGVSTVVYDDLYRPVSVTDAEGNTTLTDYDEVGNVIETTSPTGDVSTFAYDDIKQVVEAVTPRGNELFATAEDFTWRYTYDEVGNRTVVEDPEGGETTTTYDGLSRPVSVEDPLGKVTTMSYDLGGNILAVEDPNEDETTTTYDEMGRPLVVTTPEGRTVTRSYDLAGNLVRLEDGLGHATTFVYDDDGRLASQVDPRGNELGADPDDFRTVFTYDDGGQLLEVEDPLGYSLVTTFDANGNVATVTDQNNQTTTYSYDELDRVISVTVPGSATTAYAYDKVGNMVSRTDANSNVTSFTYDEANRRTGTTLPTGEEMTTVYDSEGHPVEYITGRGNAALDPADGTITSSYDSLGRVTEVDYGDATPDVTFEYDAAGRLVEMIDGAGTETYSFDDAGRMTAITRGSDVLSFTLDGDGNIVSRTSPGSQTVASTFDAAGRLATITAGGATTTYAYDAAGRLTTTTLPSGTGYTSERDYDRAGRLIGVENAAGSSILSKFERTLDPVGNPTRVDTTRGLTTTSEAFTYDGRNQLTQWCPSATTCAFASTFASFDHDQVGNRIEQVRAGIADPGTTAYAYDDSNRMTTSTIGGVPTSYAYDEDGHQVAAGATDMTYDLAGRMTSIDDGTTATSFLYDGNGKRLRATTGSDQVRYLWDPSHANAELILERDASNDLIRRHTPGVGGSALRMNDGTDDFYYLPDMLGSTADLIDDAGVAQSRYAYDPFGATTETQLVGGAPANPIRFTGEYQDPSGQLHLRARQYDPGTGRFTGVDAIDDNLGTSAYSYVQNRPGVLVDPSGMIGIGDILGASRDFGVGMGVGAFNAGRNTVSTVWDNRARLHMLPVDAFNNLRHACDDIYSQYGGGFEGTLRCVNQQQIGTQIKVGLETGARLLAEGCFRELGQMAGPVIASAALGGGAAALGRVGLAGTRAAGATSVARPLAAVRDRHSAARAAGASQRGEFTPGGLFFGRRGEPHIAVGPGKLTQAEYEIVQAIADKWGTDVFVVGSRGRSAGRNVDTDLPVGKGPGTRSDIDLVVDGQAVIDSRGRLADDIRNALPHAQVLNGVFGRPYTGTTSIRIVPR